MPELPEVETIRRTLAEHLTGSRIIQVKIIWPGALKGWENQSFEEIVCGRKIEGFERRGKYLLFMLDQGWSLIAHMRMTGRLLFYPEPRQPVLHTHVIFSLDNGELHFADVRKFGRIHAVPAVERWNVSSLAILGPEPLGPEFTPELLKERLKNKKTNIKAALLDQTVLAGLGNIYADESLFEARIVPERPAGSLSFQEVTSLYHAIQKVLKAGIASQGTSFRDYRDANGELGSFQKLLQVYGRGGEPCKYCGKPLDKKKLAGRTTVFCPECQQ